MATNETGKTVIWVYNIVNQIFTVSTPIPVDIDNQGAGYMAENQVNNSRTKHIDIRYHWIRDQINFGLIELCHIPTLVNLSDIFTKALAAPRFMMLTKWLLSGKKPDGAIQR